MSLGAVLTDALFLKRVTTLQARAARAASVLVLTADDFGQPEFVLTRHAETQRFHTMAELEGWLDAVEPPVEVL